MNYEKKIKRLIFILEKQRQLLQKQVVKMIDNNNVDEKVYSEWARLTNLLKSPKGIGWLND